MGVLFVLMGELGLCRAGPAPLEQMNRMWRYERSVKEEDLDRPGVMGKPAKSAVEGLLARGYRCGLRAAHEREPLGNETAPHFMPADLLCVREAQPDICSEIQLVVKVDWKDPHAPLGDLYDELPRSAVNGFGAFCAFKGPGSRKYLDERPAAEAKLAASIATMATAHKPVAAVFQSMAIAGFQCGITGTPSSAPEAGAGRSPSLLCTRWPGSIQYCFQEEAWFDVSWSDASAPREKLVAEFPSAQVKSVRTECALPVIPGDKSARVEPAPAPRDRPFSG
jgi:hypothetical protein